MAEVPKKLSLNKAKTVLTIFYSDKEYSLSSDYLRLNSTSAKPEPENHKGLTSQSKPLTILEIVPKGNYAVLLVFSDGHNSGIYTWQTLQKLCQEYRPVVSN